MLIIVSFRKFHDKLSDYKTYIKWESTAFDVASITTNLANKVTSNNKDKIQNQQSNHLNNHFEDNNMI